MQGNTKRNAFGEIFSLMGDAIAAAAAMASPMSEKISPKALRLVLPCMEGSFRIVRCTIDSVLLRTAGVTNQQASHAALAWMAPDRRGGGVSVI